MTAPPLVREVPIERLVQQAEQLNFNINKDDLERIAHLALEIAQAQLRRDPVNALDLRSFAGYRERSERERAQLCAHVVRVMQAMVVLGWIARPD